MAHIAHRTSTTDTANSGQERHYWLLGKKFTIIADEHDTEGRYDLIEGAPEPGHYTPLHLHTRYSETIIVLTGETTIWAGDRTLILRAGDHFVIPAGVPHVVGATGTGPSRGLVIASPSGFARLIQEGGTPDAGTPPPAPTVEEIERFDRIAQSLGDKILGPPGTFPTS